MFGILPAVIMQCNVLGGAFWHTEQTRRLIVSLNRLAIGFLLVTFAANMHHFMGKEMQTEFLMSSQSTGGLV